MLELRLRMPALPLDAIQHHSLRRITLCVARAGNSSILAAADEVGCSSDANAKGEPEPAQAGTSECP